MSKLMHNVRAYTFWFLPFYISVYTTLNEFTSLHSSTSIGSTQQQQLLLLPPASCILLFIQYNGKPVANLSKL